jgi:hypothetical protein
VVAAASFASDKRLVLEENTSSRQKWGRIERGHLTFLWASFLVLNIELYTHTSLPVTFPIAATYMREQRLYEQKEATVYA